LIDGEDVTRMPIHRRARMGLSYLPQEASIFRKLTVAENVRAVLELQLNAEGKALNDAEISARLQALLKDLRVDHLHDSPSSANAGVSKLPAPWPQTLASFCWTSLLRALIRLP
jgi:lipopolysaccharide export system ATP-binding protein